MPANSRWDLIWGLKGQIPDQEVNILKKESAYISNGRFLFSTFAIVGP